MIKTILLCVDGSKYAEAAMGTALWFSKELKTQLHVLSVVDIQLLEGPWLSDLSGIMGVQPFQALVPQLRELYERKAQTAIEEVMAAAKQQGVKCQAEVETGSLVNEILEAERTAELVVMGQRGEGFEATGEWLGSHVERILRKSIKPCLITPLEFRPIRSILVAYDGSQHANHALYVAFDLTKALKTKLSILVVENAGDEEKKSWVLKEGLDLAEKQGIQAFPLLLHGSPEERIVEAATQQKFDLIVMGAYGHTRLRELVLGSVTSHVVRKSPVAVLLAR